MKFDYKASEKDFKIIEESIKIVYSPKLNYIFKDNKILDKVYIISFDSKFIYIWTKKKIHGFEPIHRKSTNYYFYKINHNLYIKGSDRMGWRAGVWLNEINDLLPVALRKNDFAAPKICGSLLEDFIDNQIKIKGEKNNPYITKESYLATIVHEFGHVYYQRHKNWWFSDKYKNLQLLENALDLYKEVNKKINAENAEIEIPQPFLFSEVFAFCCEYEASQIFFPNHKKELDKFAMKIIEESVKEEKQKNLDGEDSILSDKTSHKAAFVLGKILIEKYPKTWPKELLKKSLF
nr:hypothetical protein [Candidatus Levybacteria bacterium]